MQAYNVDYITINVPIATFGIIRLSVQGHEDTTQSRVALLI